VKISTRRTFVVGNWTMHTIASQSAALAKVIVDGLGIEDRVSVAICPPFPYLSLVGSILKGSLVALGAQNLYPQKERAFTGEVSPTMLLDLGFKYVILEHRERRHVLGESDAFINCKVRCALEAGLDIFLCVGETHDERNAGQTQGVLDRQVTAGLGGVSTDLAKRITVGYEPVWAIGGRGHRATPQQAESSLTLIRSCFGRIFGANPADALCILYGGSVKPENAAALLTEPDCDGAFIGGSLNAEEFPAIVQAAVSTQQTQRRSQ
jgi:triosephosphate isomerase